MTAPQDDEAPTTDRTVDDVLPTLSPETIDDDELLGSVIDAVMQADPQARERAEQIAMHQGWLRAMVDADTWKLVLEIESRQNERWSDLTLVITRWAFNEGRKHPLPQEGGRS